MVNYADPEFHPELGEPSRTRAGATPADRAALIKKRAERIRASKERNAALTGDAAFDAAREIALRQLDSRSRSRAELHTAITSRGFDDQVAQQLLDRLEQVGLINDQAFADMVVRDRFSLRGSTGPALRRDLARRGLSSEVIDAAMAQVDRDDEYDRARQLVAQKIRSCPADREKAWRRLTGMLARKGYSGSVCSTVVAEALDARDGENDGPMGNAGYDW